jgi:hypothetical protein
MHASPHFHKRGKNMKPIELIFTKQGFKTLAIYSGISRSSAEVIATGPVLFRGWKSTKFEGDGIFGKFALKLAHAQPKNFAEKAFGVSSYEGEFLLNEKRIAKVELTSGIYKPLISVWADTADILVEREHPRIPDSDYLIKCTAYGTVAVWHYGGCRTTFREIIDSRFGFGIVESGRWEIPFSEFSKEAHKTTVACLLSVLVLMNTFGVEDSSAD